MIWNDFVVTGKVNVVIKTILERTYMMAYNNSVIVNQLIKLQNKALEGVFWVCSTRVFWCFPCHERRARRRNNRQDRRVIKDKISELERLKNGLNGSKKNN